MLGNFVLTNYESLEFYTANVFLFYWQNHGHIIVIRTMMISELNTLQQRHLNFSNFPNKLVGGYLGIFGGGVLPGFPTPSLRSRRCTRKNVCARRRHARGDLTLWPCFISSRIRNKVVFLTHILEFVFCFGKTFLVLQMQTTLSPTFPLFSKLLAQKDNRSTASQTGLKKLW